MVENEVQVKKNISLVVHTSLETSGRYVSETVDEKIWHWGLLKKSAKKQFLCIFDALFWFWHILPTRLLFLVINQQMEVENIYIRHVVPPWGILMTFWAQKGPFCLKRRLTGRKATKCTRAPQECPKHRQTIFPDEPFYLSCFLTPFHVIGVSQGGLTWPVLPSEVPQTYQTPVPLK